MIWIAKFNFCGGWHWKNGRCQMIGNFDGEVVWSIFDQGNLLPGLTWVSEEEIGAFDEKIKKAPDLFPRYPMA
jgi:hypothetical protein